MGSIIKRGLAQNCISKILLLMDIYASRIFFLICHHILNPVTSASRKVLSFIFKLKLVLWYSYKRTTRKSQNYLAGSVVTNQGEMPGPERCYVTQAVHIFVVKCSCQEVKGYTFLGSSFSSRPVLQAR